MSEGSLDCRPEFCRCAKKPTGPPGVAGDVVAGGVVYSPLMLAGLGSPAKRPSGNACSRQTKENCSTREADGIAGQLCRGGASGNRADTHRQQWGIRKHRMECSHLANTTEIHLHVVWMNFCHDVSAFLPSREVQVTAELV